MMKSLIVPDDHVQIKYNLGKCYNGQALFRSNLKKQDLWKVPYADGGKASLFIPISHLYIIWRYIIMLHHTMSDHASGSVVKYSNAGR